MKKKTTFKTPMMDSCCNNDFQKKPKLNKKFEVAFVGLQINNGRYELNCESENSMPNASMCIKGSKEFTMGSAFKIVAKVNDYMPNLSQGEFKTQVDGIKFTCNVVRM